MLPESFTPKFLRNLELLRIHTRKVFMGMRQGGHASTKRGQGIEFSDYRQYQLGDNPRYIDWGLYGRSDKLYVKRFSEEQELSVLIILDTSASMTTPISDLKWEMARDIALSLAYIAFMDRDSVSVSALGYFNSPRYSGARAIHRLSQELMQLKVGGNYDLEKEMQLACAKVKFPGKAIYISDFLMPIEQIRSALDVIRAKNLDLSAIQVLSPSDINPLPELEYVDAIDSETAESMSLRLSAKDREEYKIALNDHNHELEDLFARSQVSFAKIVSDQDLGEFTLNNLTQIGLLR